MGFFGNKKQAPMPEASETISLSLTPAEIDLLRECMKRTEDYYRGLLLLKQDWNAEKKRSGHCHDKDQVEYDRQATGKNTV